MAEPRPDRDFPRLVSLACHDMRTPLATVSGFARTLPRLIEAGEREARFLELMATAAEQLAELLDDLALVARIEDGRYDPVLRAVYTLDLARGAASRLGGNAVEVSGQGGDVVADPEAAERALAHLLRCALRHGPLERVELRAEGRNVMLEPVDDALARILLADDLRDLGAAIAVRVIAALGGATEAADGRLVVRLPLEPVVS